MHKTLSVTALFTLLCAVFFFFVGEKISAFVPPEIHTLQYGSTIQAFTAGSMLFGGDIMLSRDVERYIEAYGDSYPFLGIRDRIASYDVAIANFEASVPEEHRVTKPGGMRFSVKPDYLGTLTDMGIDALSLANNHTNDYGRPAYEHTRAVCGTYGLRCIGDPLSLSATSSAVFMVGDVRVGVIFIHGLRNDITKDAVERAVDAIAPITDYQIAFIHWGDEYKSAHNEVQEKMAHMLIDAGVDSVIGHHPHVIEDIGFYKGKPIFYSLGNLIFDQYFSDGVQTGYMLGLDFDADRVTYTLIPIGSKLTRGQPHILSGTPHAAVIETLLSALEYPGIDREAGTMVLPYTD